jgi:hypothetical protein
MLRDAAVAANVAWLAVALAYMLAAGDLDGETLFVFVLIGIGFPCLNLLALFRGEAGEERWSRRRRHSRP